MAASLHRLTAALFVTLSCACVTSDPISSGGGGDTDDDAAASGSGGAFTGAGAGDASGSGGASTTDTTSSTTGGTGGSTGASGPVCDDGVCDAAEDCASCWQDCGVCACAPDAYEPNDTSPKSTTITTGTDHCGVSVCASDVDWFDVPSTTSFTATITFAQGQGDLDLEVYSGVDFSYVDGAYSHDDDESITLTGLPAGPYFVRVYGYQGAQNPDYCVRVDVP